MSRPIDDLLVGLGLDAVTPTPTEPLSFSVIVRTQGRRPGSLLEAVESVTAQTHSARELLVMVHADPPTVHDVERQLSVHITSGAVRLVAVVGGGRARPLNAGLDAANGDYVCFLDDDDLVAPDWLAAFAQAATAEPARVVRAVTRTQRWTTEGGEEPVRPLAEPETPFAAKFDLLTHMSHNETPICSIALPMAALRRFGLRFDETLPVYEDWDLLMRVAMLVGVTSIPDQTSLYRRLDRGNADTAEEARIWHETHTRVIDRLSAHPLLLPAGDARRVASAHFVPGGGSRHEGELLMAQADLDAITRSPWTWARAFARRGRAAARRRISARRP